MRLTVLGACGAWPEAGRACSGYLVEQDGFRLLVDVGYATVPRLFELVGAGEVDAVFVSHGHPDHCADLNPLLRARTLFDGPPCRSLPVYSPPGALDAVLALDRPGMLADAYRLRPFAIGEELYIGPFRARTALLPHWLPDAGVRLTAGGRTLVYTGDAGAAPEVVALARDADVLLAEATFVEEVPEDSRGYLCSAAEAGRQASQAGVGRLVLTHLQPGTDRRAARAAAAHGYDGPIDVADGGLAIELR
jgi:ribonuclease BN (tRNA processing enzyme)